MSAWRCTRFGVAALSAAPLVVACGGTSQAVRSSVDLATASDVCGALKAFDNRVGRIVNQAVLPVHEQSPGERVAAIMDALGDVDRELIGWATEIEQLELLSPEADRLRAELQRGAESVRSEVSDASADFEAIGRLADDDIAGGVGQLFTSIEKVLSELEPSIAAYDREDFRVAFAEMPDCRHVTQLGQS